LRPTATPMVKSWQRDDRERQIAKATSPGSW
jgi:hypothetical protein